MRRPGRLQTWLDHLSAHLSFKQDQFGYLTLPAGIIDFWPTPGRSRKWITLQAIWVNLKARRRGLGSKWLRAICRCADANGYHVLIRIRPYGKRSPAKPKLECLRRWYGKHGFRPLRGSIYYVRHPQ
jgi:GNAT superfamily N-acetyltransferase